mmetsp:Transcript_40364/g.54838  ORF Transcript_40364/g.54838 Transcript_40364/m.54838 type:complete len:82 (+) Transcript_40364:915-1160(+)
MLNLSEFLAATITIDEADLTEERKKALFMIFDVDNMGYLTRDGLVKAFNKLGRKLTSSQLDDIFDQEDEDSNEQISEEEWS